MCSLDATAARILTAVALSLLLVTLYCCRMLDDLNEDTDKASEALQTVTKKTKELIEQSGCSYCFGELDASAS